MKYKPWATMLIASTLAASVSSSFAFDPTIEGGDFGAVYTMTNAPTGNQILIFNRDAKGALTAAGAISTNGTGSGGGVDALGSQHSLVLSRDDRWLFAANAGSNEISVLRVRPGSLEFTYKIASGGVFPVSIAHFHNLVYVLNVGAKPNITGFKVEHDGHLVPIPNSTRTISATALGQIGFDSKGEALVVTDKGSSKIIAFAVDKQGLPATTPVISPSNGNTPFGFTFDKRDHLLVVEAASDAVSSYKIESDDTLQRISSSVANGQKAACWIASSGYRYVFTANPGTHTISSYDLNLDTGEITLLNGSAGTGNTPLDIATTKGGKFLYALDAGSQQIDAFQVGEDGSLTNLGAVSGNFSNFAQGIAVR